MSISAVSPAPPAVNARGLSGLLFQAGIFVKRGFVHNASYRLNFTLSVVNVLIGLVSYYFLSHVVTGSQLGPYKDNPAGYIVVGTTFTTFVNVALASYSGSIRSEMFLGTIEHWLLSAASLTRLVVLSTVWEFLWPLITTMITFTFLVAILGVHFNPDWLTVFVFFLLTLITMSGFGLISAGIIMVSKIGDPLSTGWAAVNTLLIGALFPVSVLPGWMQAISAFLPNTHALEGLRQGMLLHASLASQARQLVITAGFCVIVVPLGAISFRLGFERARAQGTLGQF
jgi:ABC-2 type transport system permease protein